MTLLGEEPILTVAALVVVSGPLLPSDASSRGRDSWWNQTPWRELILLATMILGMQLRVAWDAIDAHRQSRTSKKPLARPVLDPWAFASPVIASLVVFQPVLSMGEGQPMSVKLALFSLQNGFFWNTIFARLRLSKERAKIIP